MVTSAPEVALPVNDVVAEEPVVLMAPEPVGLGEEAPVAVLAVTPVPGPVTPPLMVESEAVPVADPETPLLVELDRSEVRPPRSELSRPEPDAVALGDAVEETPVPVPGPVTPPEIVEDASAAVSVTVDDAVATPVLGPVSPPEMMEVTSVADTSVADVSVVEVPRSVLVRLETSEESPAMRELKRPPLDDVAVAVALVPVPTPVIPETMVSVSELVAVSLAGVAVELVTPVPGPVADASMVEAVSVEASAVSVAETVVELVTPVPGPVADASIVDVSPVEVVVGNAVVADSVADASIEEVESVDEASSVFARLVTSETRLVTSEMSALPRELSPSPSPPVDAVMEAAAESIVDVVSEAVMVAESVVEEIVSVAEVSVVEDTIMPLEVCEASETVSEAVEETMPVGAITIEVNADDVGSRAVLVVVSSTTEETVVPSEELGVKLTVGEISLVSLEVVVSEPSASRDERKLESEDEGLEPCREGESSLLVRLSKRSDKDRPWLVETPAVVTSAFEGTGAEEKVVTVTLVYALLTSRGK